MIIFVPLQDISGMEGRDFKNDTDAEVIARLRQVYDFLPKETNISVEDGIVRIDIPESAIANKEDAVRLLDKGSERAKRGEYQKAVGIFSRVLELDPSNIEARRNLGMAFMELAWISTVLNSPNAGGWFPSSALRGHGQRQVVPPGDADGRVQQS